MDLFLSPLNFLAQQLQLQPFFLGRREFGLCRAQGLRDRFETFRIFCVEFWIGKSRFHFYNRALQFFHFAWQGLERALLMIREFAA